MKNIVRFIPVAFLAFALLIGCAKKDDTPVAATPSTTPTYTIAPANGFMAKVDGNQFTATKIVASVRSSGELNIMASVGSAGMGVYLKKIKEGTFTLDTLASSTINNIMFYSADTTQQNTNGFYPVGLAQLVITKYDSVAKKISGTFSFNVKDNNGNKKKVTEGSFTSISYTPIIPAGGGAKNVISCTVDGTAYTFATIYVDPFSQGDIRIDGYAPSPGINGFPYLFVSLNTNATVGSYDLNSTNSSHYHIEYSPTDILSYDCAHTRSAGSASAGTITITKNDVTAKVITGTFSATVTNISANAKDSKAITNGTFTAVYK